MEEATNPDAIWRALQIQMRVEPRAWPAALEQVPEAMRLKAEAYLRAQARFMRNRRASKREGSGDV